ncbi:TIR domain-containing protein [Crocinitomix algicola]|uniref:TIR domain-containing protein n=1 Tax=Crocinitomix algicola TaxID=1740263 RepID=UPI000871C25A|nr:TIR domain-containing protein [Crocinitomix algicola]
MADTSNIFISHYGKDDHHVQSLKERLKGGGFNVRNFSIDSTKHKDGRKPSDAVVKRLLNIRIKQSSTVICLIGPETHNRKWVNYEIRKAYAEGKRIVGVYTHGNKDNVELPTTFKRYGSALLGWNSIDKLGDIVSGNNSDFENESGGVASPLYNIKRISC